MKKRVTKKELVEKAKQGDKDAELDLLELNQSGILEEAKNPDTSEEIAIEMLAELTLSPISLIRSKAISLLTKLVPEKLKEKLLEDDVAYDAKEKIVETILESSNLDVFLFMSLYDSENFPDSLKSKILDKINSIRKSIEKNAVEIMKLQSQVEELETMKKEKFQIIKDLYTNLKTVRTESLSNKIFHDFKLDVELSYQSLKNNIEID